MGFKFVWEWLEITRKEYLEKCKAGTCIVCGKQATDRFGVLCKEHEEEFGEWANEENYA